ncbi:MAG: class I SAM-dependent methyltransferase [Chthoniobacterales bacterium]
MKHPILRRIPGARQWIEKIERLEAERDRLTRKLQKLESQPPVVAAPSPPLSRSRREQYKDVWTKLSETERSAKMHVGGFEDEETFEREGIRTKEHLLSSVGIHPDDVVIEIGCGVGRVGKQLAPLCRQWIGCDVSPNMVALAAKRLAQFPIVEVHEISGFDLQPLPNESADVVYCTVVFMHLDEWDRYNYVVEADRVLRPAGRIFIDNVDLCSDAGWEVFELHRPIPPADRPPHITKHSTEQELTTYLQRAGFGEIATRQAKEFIQAWGMK